MRARSAATFAGALTLTVAGVIGGWAGLLYAIGYAVATAPGWPVGLALFGRRHPAGWIAGAVLGYGLTALAIWVPIALGTAWWLPFLLSWTTMTAATWLACRSVRDPWVELPAWGRRDTLALAMTLVLVPALVVLPYGRIGEIDAEGNRRYRAYFTADFVWHEALTAELARFSSPPRNPYMSASPLHYYWSYFLLPAAVTGVTDAAGATPPIESYLAVNGLCSGLLLVAAVFLLAWTAVPRAGPAFAATAVALLASSAEGLYAAADLLRRGRSLDALRYLNIDAITSWNFQALTVDGLQRSIWYTPQHAMACTLGLVALTVAARKGAKMRPAGAAAAGLALGLAFTMSPFPAGAMTLVYALAVLWDGVLLPRTLPRTLAIQMIPAGLVAAALAWCVVNGTFEGAGGAIAFGVSRRAAVRPLTVLGLAVGPVLLPAIAGAAISLLGGVGAHSASARERRGAQGATRATEPGCGSEPHIDRRSIRPSIAGVGLALGLFFGVTLVLEPIWIGWRAGQILLVTAPGLVALTLATLASVRRVGRGLAIAFATLLLAAGLPTTVVDVYNAQDTSNDAMGPGFRWTVVLTPDEQQALNWIVKRTPRDAVVQMSLVPRGRETWTLIPSFARRRMAAGLPISLLRTPDYDAGAAAADRLYATEDSEEAWRIAHDLGIDYVYVGRVERDAFGASALKFGARPDLFASAFANAEVAVYGIR